MGDVVFTIGHSTHPQGRLMALLLEHGITVLCDVRSEPYSRVNPQFNREDLKRSLRERGIRYVFMGKELGARSRDEACYEDGKVQYDRIARTELFQRGLERIQKGIRDYRVVLMCAEKEPLECHRAILIARHLVRLGVDVQHIHADGKMENHSDALKRLLRMLNLQEQGMFQSHDELLADAYRRQEVRIAYDSTSALRGKLAAGSAAG